MADLQSLSVTLVDRSQETADALKEAFAGVPNVIVRCGDIFDYPAAAMAIPANSFGFMDGGFDLAVRDRLGTVVEERLQDGIHDYCYGELVIGQAVIFDTDHEKWPHLIASPTMRVPENVSDTLNAYYAFRAILLAAMTHPEVDAVVCPGLCTGVGGMTAVKAARQMREAYHQVANHVGAPWPPKPLEIFRQQDRLTGRGGFGG